MPQRQQPTLPLQKEFIKSQDVLTVDHDGSVAILTFTWHEILNALNSSLRERSLKEVEPLNYNSNVRTIVVRGTGRTFSIGCDMKTSVERKMDNMEDWETQMKLLF